MKRALFILKLMGLLSLTAMLANCAKDSDSSSTTTTTTGYYVSNGNCYATATGTIVDYSYCNTSTTLGYYLSNGICYSSYNGQAVAYSYCSSTSTTTTSQCYGQYYYYYYGRYQTVYCNGTNCRGYTLLNQYGQQVTCQ